EFPSVIGAHDRVPLHPPLRQRHPAVGTNVPERVDSPPGPKEDDGFIEHGHPHRLALQLAFPASHEPVALQHFLHMDVMIPHNRYLLMIGTPTRFSRKLNSSQTTLLPAGRCRR